MSKVGLSSPTIGVLICAYNRPFDLNRLLLALDQQSHTADDVMVVSHETDRAVRSYLRDRLADDLPLRSITVGELGVVAARNAGIEACRTDLIVMVDDDTEPRPDFLARIFAHFQQDPTLGALGGRDRCHDGIAFDDREEYEVGKISWFGRAIGNHHLGVGPLRDVHFLKGANMSFRVEAVAGLDKEFPMRGKGSQPYQDTAFSMAIRRKGWRLRYDPAVLLNHYAGKRVEPRYYATIGGVTDVPAFRDYAYNEVICYWSDFSPVRLIAYAMWSLFIGVGISPGLVQAVRYTPRLGVVSWYRFFLVQQGKAQAFGALLSTLLRRDHQYQRSAKIHTPGSEVRPTLPVLSPKSGTNGLGVQA